MNHKNLFLRITMVCIGVFFMGFSISLLVYANLGTDPCTCMNQGLSAKAGLSFGVWQLIINSVFLIITFFVSRKLIGIGTVINMVSVGFLVDFFTWVFAFLLPAHPSLPLRAAALIAAVVLLAFTAALYMYPQLGVSPYDGLAIMVSERTGFSFRWCRIGSDAAAVLVGFFSGGVAGIGTVLTAFCMGPLIKAFYDRIAKKFPMDLPSVLE